MVDFMGLSNCQLVYHGRSRKSIDIMSGQIKSVDSVSVPCYHVYMWRKEEVIQKLRGAQGNQSLRSYARSIGCSAAYLSDVYLGKRNPGPKFLDHLGLERETVTTVTYRKRRWR